jgi:hypothetical protein
VNIGATFGEVRSMQTFLKYPPVTVITLDTTAFFNNSKSYYVHLTICITM